MKTKLIDMIKYDKIKEYCSRQAFIEMKTIKTDMIKYDKINEYCS